MSQPPARRPSLWALTALLACLAIAFVAVGCGSDDEESSGGSSTTSEAAIPDKPEPGTFRIGIQPWIGYGAWWVAQDQGIFEKHGLEKVELTNFTTDDQINAAFAGGKIDGINLATHSALRYAAQGIDLKIVLVEDVSTTADAVLGGKGVETIKDLKGKRVAYEEGTTSDILLSYALAENGMTKEDIKPVPMAAADAGTAFIAGRVDAAVTYEPYLTTARKRDKAVKLIYSAGENPGLISDAFAVKAETLEKKPGQVAALVKSWGEAVSSYDKDKGAAQAIIAKQVGSPVADLETAFDGVELYDLAENQEQLSGEYVNKTMKDVHKAATDSGLLEGDVDPKDIVVARFVDEVAGS